MKKIAMILHTNGLEYDDRIRKEMLTVTRLFPYIQFKIFAIIDGNQSQNEQGVTEYGIEYEVPLLTTRLKYKQGTHLLEKAWDFYKTIKPKLNDFDAIWCADFDIFFFILCEKKNIIWDMRELPTVFMGNILKRKFLIYLIKQCKVVIHANPERIQYLVNQQIIKDTSKHYVIHNYPDFDDVSTYTDSTFENFLKWKGEDKCVYIQGANNYGRCDKECIDAIMEIKNLKAVVVGNFRKELKDSYFNKFGEDFFNRIYFTGMVSQKLTPRYIRCCQASLVFYRNIGPNNYYCEPNRMFQSIMNDCPVVVGCNPPMKNLVEKYKFGISLKSDGTNTSEIIDALHTVLDNYQLYCSNISKNKSVIEWRLQEQEFRSIMNQI